MTGKPHSDPSKPATLTRAHSRNDRLKTALKANMAKRKAQAKARSVDATAGMTGPEKVEK